MMAIGICVFFNACVEYSMNAGMPFENNKIIFIFHGIKHNTSYN